MAALPVTAVQIALYRVGRASAAWRDARDARYGWDNPDRPDLVRREDAAMKRLQAACDSYRFVIGPDA